MLERAEGRLPPVEVVIESLHAFVPGPLLHCLADFEHPVHASRIPGWSELVERLLGVLAGGLGVTLRPHDLRHSGVTLNLNAGVPALEVARRAGHGVAVLLRVYAGCIDGHEPALEQPYRYRALGRGRGMRLFRRGFAYTRQSPGLAGNPGEGSRQESGRICAGQGQILLVVAGVGFEPT